MLDAALDTIPRRCQRNNHRSQLNRSRSAERLGARGRPQAIVRVASEHVFQPLFKSDGFRIGQSRQPEQDAVEQVLERLGLRVTVHDSTAFMTALNSSSVRPNAFATRSANSPSADSILERIA